MTRKLENSGTPQTLQESLIRILLIDVITAQERLNANASQSNMRDLIRCGFAAIDGMIWLFCEHVASIAKNMDALSPIEELALAQTSYYVSGDGEVREQPRFLSTLVAIRLATHIARRMVPDLETDFGDEAWSKLRDAIQTRNRITHPKQRSDLILDQTDIGTCMSGLHWILELVERVMTRTNIAFATHTAELWQAYEALERGDPEVWRLYREALNSSEE